jgi:hypothetical protein
MFSQNVQYTQKVQECRSLRIELSRLGTTPSVSSTSQSSASPPSPRAASPTPFQSKLASRYTRSASVAPTSPTHSVAPSTNRPDYAGTTTSSVRPLNNLNVPTAPSHSQKSPTSIGAPASPVPTQSALGADTSSPQGVNSPLMSTPGNAGIGAGGGPPSPADSSEGSDTAYPYRAKALYACACQNSLAFAFDLTMYYRHRVR